jgi:tetratricopeptide (TPR) repeat protein
MNFVLFEIIRDFLLLLLFLRLVILPAFAAAPSNQKLQEFLNLGEQSQLSHDMRRAEMDYLKAIEEAAKFGPKSPETQESEARLAAVYVLQGKLEAAAPHYQKAKDIALALKKEGHEAPESFVWLDDLSDAYQLQAATTQPEYCYLHCIELRKAISPRHKNLASVETQFGSLLLMNGKVAEGDKYLKEGYALSATLDGAESHNTGKLCLILANAYNIAGKLTDAEKFCKEAIAITLKRSGNLNTVLANLRRMDAVILTKMGKTKEALSEVKTAMELHKRLDGVKSAEYAYDLSCLATIYMDSHRLNEAEATVTESLAIFQTQPHVIKELRTTTLALAVKIARLQHHNSQAAKWEAELKTWEAKR